MSLAHSLTTLETSGLIRLAQLDPELEYLFRHALVQEATYASILKSDRRTLHRMVAETLERLYPEHLDSLAFLLGRHWREAGEVESARQQFIRAGEFARKIYANGEAIAAYTEALSLTMDDTERFDLLVARVAVYDVIAARDEQRADIDAMLNLAKKINDDARRCDAFLALSDYHLNTEHILAREPAERALEIARKLNDSLHEGRALQRLGIEANSRFNSSESCHWLEMAVAHFREVGESNETAACLNILGLVLANADQLSDARKYIEEAISISQSLVDVRQEGIGLRRLAIIATKQNNYADALQHAEMAISLHRKLGDRTEECHALNILGQVYLGLAQIKAAQNCFHQSLEIAETIKLRTGFWNALNSLIQVYRESDEYETGLVFLKPYLVQARDEEDDVLLRNIQVWGCVPFLMEFGQYEEVLEILNEVLPITEKMMDSYTFINDLSRLSWVYAELGYFQLARQKLGMAFRLDEKVERSRNEVQLLLISVFVALMENKSVSLHNGLESVDSAIAIAERINHKRGLATGFNLKAQLLLELGRNEEALLYTQKRVNIFRINNNMNNWGMNYLGNFFFTHSRALRANGHEAEADEYLQKAYDRVMLVASKTKDDTLRQSWLENVRDNREIIAEWNARHPEQGNRETGTQVQR